MGQFDHYSPGCQGRIDWIETAMNIAAIVGQMMNPLLPNVAMPPSVVIITT
jgi:hypothetical protein